MKLFIRYYVVLNEICYFSILMLHFGIFNAQTIPSDFKSNYSIIDNNVFEQFGTPGIVSGDALIYERLLRNHH